MPQASPRLAAVALLVLVGCQRLHTSGDGAAQGAVASVATDTTMQTKTLGHDWTSFETRIDRLPAGSYRVFAPAGGEVTLKVPETFVP